ncbi:alpha/beta hydrolase family protein [Nocardioides sp.]|uniref:alpha/beta hydrolase family protein n=1 Tax=Nocardioides sp. TaxID=35761 RepID=UPI0035176B6F
MHRRTLLRLPAVGALGAIAASGLAACGADDVGGANGQSGPSTPGEENTVPSAEGVHRSTHRYGDDPSQYGELFLPDPVRKPRGVVVVIHGGFWRAEYDASLGTPLAADLAARGWAAWNLEYRRVGDGGGAPATFDDVAAGIDKLADISSVTTEKPALDLSRVITLGHSAGGHLATWSAARGRYGFSDDVAVTHVISQAGVLDLRAAAEAGLGNGAETDLLGHRPSREDERYDPAQQLPLDVPVWCVHGKDDDTVPIGQSESYVERATAAGATAELIAVEGDHFVVIDPSSEAWARQLQVLDTIAPA